MHRSKLIVEPCSAEPTVNLLLYVTSERAETCSHCITLAHAPEHAADTQISCRTIEPFCACVLVNVDSTNLSVWLACYSTSTVYTSLQLPSMTRKEFGHTQCAMMLMRIITIS